MQGGLCLCLMSVYIWHMKQWGTALFIGVSLMFLGCSEEHCVSPRWYGYDCEVVQIGAQCWFSENLRTEVYRNGDEIAYCGGDDEWRNAPSGMRCSYEHDAQMDMVSSSGRRERTETACTRPSFASRRSQLSVSEDTHSRFERAFAHTCFVK